MFGRVNIGGGSNIKSIQRGMTSFLSSENNKTIIINSVNPDNTICFVRMRTNGDVWYDMSIELLSSTQIKVSQYAEHQTDAIIWEVIEFNNIKSKQTGISLIEANAASITISSVNVGKTLIFATQKSKTTQDGGYAKLSYNLTSATTLGVWTLLSNPRDIYWQVIEFY